MSYNPRFDRLFNGKFNLDNNFISIKNGSEAYLIEDELNEMQWIQNEQRAQFIRSILNSGLLYKKLNISNNSSEDGVLILNDNSSGIDTSNLLFNIKNYIPINMNGYIFKFAGTYKKDINNIETNNNNILISLPEPPKIGDRKDLVYLEVWFEEINCDSNNDIKKYGGELNDSLDIFKKDERLNLETTHRIQLKWKIVVAENANKLSDLNVFPQKDPNNNNYKLSKNYPTQSFCKDENLYVSDNNITSINKQYYAIPLLLINRTMGKTIIQYEDLQDISPISKILISLGENIKIGNENPIEIINDENNNVEIKDDNDNYANLIIKSIVLNNGSNAINDFITGEGMFNSLNGVTITHNCNDPNYKVIILPNETTSGDIGEYWVESKNENSFVIKNTGENSVNTFNWILIKNTTTNFILGEGTFNSLNGITIPHNYGNIDYKVFILPNQETTGNIGEYWVESKNENSFVIKNTGENSTNTFDWVLVKNDNENIISGSETFNGLIGSTINHACNTLNYKVFILPNQETTGNIGEYWIDDKTHNSFVIKNTGENNTNIFDWILVKTGNNGGSININNVDNVLSITDNDGSYADVILGNLTVKGESTIVKSEIVEIDDNTITLNSNVNGDPIENGGMEIKRGNQINASLIWNENEKCWKAGLKGSEQRISLINFGNDANKPIATDSKVLYITIDTKKIYFDNGSWLQIGGQDTIDWNGIINKPTSINSIDPKFHYDSVEPTGSTRLNYDGNFYATKIFNAVYNDYAEYFKKGEQTVEPGDVVICDLKDKYIKSQKAYDNCVVGVYSDSFGMCIGGEGKDNDEMNYIPVGLAGRVSVKVTGNIKKGDLLVSSDIPGVAMKSNNYAPGTVIGKALESHNGNEVNKIKMLIMNI